MFDSIAKMGVYVRHFLQRKIRTQQLVDALKVEFSFLGRDCFNCGARKPLQNFCFQLGFVGHIFQTEAGIGSQTENKFVLHIHERLRKRRLNFPRPHGIENVEFFYTVCDFLFFFGKKVNRIFDICQRVNMSQ